MSNNDISKCIGIASLHPHMNMILVMLISGLSLSNYMDHSITNFNWPTVASYTTCKSNKQLYLNYSKKLQGGHYIEKQKYMKYVFTY